MVRERRNKMDCLPNALRIGDVERNESRRRDELVRRLAERNTQSSVLAFISQKK